jgi:hypothetical protein
MATIMAGDGRPIRACFTIPLPLFDNENLGRTYSESGGFSEEEQG